METLYKGQVVAFESQATDFFYVGRFISENESGVLLQCVDLCGVPKMINVRVDRSKIRVIYPDQIIHVYRNSYQSYYRIDTVHIS